MKEENVLLVESLMGGIGLELCNEQIQKCLDNIVDPNTSPKKARKVILTITITPDETRSVGSTEVTCTSKLATNIPAKATVFFGRNAQGGGTASEANRDQMKMFAPEKKADNVIPMKTEVK